MSIRISTQWSYEQSLTTMMAQQAAVNASQNEVTSGKRINVASDDPTGAGKAISLSHMMAGQQQYSDSIDSANTRMSTETTTLDSVTNLLDSARTLALQSINGSLAPADRQSIATNLSQIRDQLMQLGNTADSNGDALFGGTSGTSTPFIQNADGSVSYTGTDSQLYASIGSGLQIATGDTGSSIFMNNANGNGTFSATAASGNTGSLVVGGSSVTDATAYANGMASNGSYTINFDGAGNWTATDAGGNPVLDTSGNPVGGTYKDGDNISFNGMTIAMTGTPAAGDSVTVGKSQNQDIFGTLNNMINALNSGASGASLNNVMNRQIESLDSTQSAVTNTQVLVGARMNTLDQQSSAYADLKVSYTNALTAVTDADPATAISQLSMQSAALSASQQVFVKAQQLTLFNYIK
ncbi:flagellar hook-associated protein FlgL [Pinirhizobacter soli]|uniref:flagellar hook-associated protein FlgL n=1 Tax=Pinirhizobacter soli TaxID=2786953 RepID=UPI00202A752F|nr:flagellar hook-associated protein FlgL [Pinirhizobacter soli]